jgi:hypothetical protein
MPPVVGPRASGEEASPVPKRPDLPGNGLDGRKRRLRAHLQREELSLLFLIGTESGCGSLVRLRLR